MTTSVDRHIFNMAKSLGAVECFDKATFDFVDDLCNCIENKSNILKFVTCGADQQISVKNQRKTEKIRSKSLLILSAVQDTVNRTFE